jgi:murein DD-endopeptidase MepM/ murein hydrolase activator NlpD
MRKFLLGFVSCLALSLLFYFTNASKYLSFPKAAHEVTTSPETPALTSAPEQVAEIKEPTFMFGIQSDSFLVINETIKYGEGLSDILREYNISPAQVYELSRKAKKIFNVRQIQANKPYTLLCDNDSAQTARYFIYQPNVKEYVVFNLQDSLSIYKTVKEVESVERTIAGTIKSSLYETMVEAGCSPGLINYFADIFAWKINFAAVQPGDKFKLIYEEQQVEGEVVGYGELKAAYFEHAGKPYYAIRYDQGRGPGFFDEEGKSLKKAFLKEPLEYSRISSRFSKSRFHPVQKRYKAHLGTDFAAPRGTPIRSVGEGIVIAAGYTKGNGNYVKIKHDNTYTTQYLHMSKFAKGIRKGARVNMGQTIGYVGSTGLASGPHLCYRFWKNGKQVDALKQKLPAARSIDKKHKEVYEQLSQELISLLNNFDTEQPVLAESNTISTESLSPKQIEERIEHNMIY